MKSLKQFLTSIKTPSFTVAKCCGIVGYAGPREASPILMDGIELLQNRGYDSCGVATAKNGDLIVSKCASLGTTSDSIDRLKKSLLESESHHGHTMGIAHTRWATHGGKTDANAHPHADYKNRITLVHNGTIDNFYELKKEMTDKGVPFQSQTDTEVIANLIGTYMDSGMNFQDATREATKRLRGTWGLLVMCKDDPSGFMCARNGSPLIVGFNKGEIFVGSEPLALSKHTNEYVTLNDGDVVYLNKDTSTMDNLADGRDRHDVQIDANDLKTSPTPYEHWTLKEIFDQIQSINRALNFGGRIAARPQIPFGAPQNRFSHRRIVKLGGFDSKPELGNIDDIVLTGCGTSLHAGLFAMALFQQLGCFRTTQVVDSSELNDSLLSNLESESSAVIALSQSGETRDVVNALDIAKRCDLETLSVVNQVGSLVARKTGRGVYVNAGREVAVASTKAFTSQIVCLALIGSWFTQQKARMGRKCTAAMTKADELIVELTRLPVVAQEMLTNDKCAQVKKLAESLASCKHMFLLGKDTGHAVALESALKIKEISYIHAEGFAGGQLKHGPFAMIEPQSSSTEGTPVILFIFDGPEKDVMLNAAQQVAARGARCIVVTDSHDINEALPSIPHDDILSIPHNGHMTALGAIFPMQLLAYYLATAKGINPDKPRGLAKTVTVK